MQFKKLRYLTLITLLSLISLLLVVSRAHATTDTKNNIKPPPIKTITFSMQAAYPPFEYMNAAGEIKGFDVDIANALCQHIGATCSFTNEPWDSLIPNLQLGKIDALISAIAITDERKKQIDFTKPYYFYTVSIVGPKNKTFELTKAGMTSKRIGILIGTTFQQYLKATYGNLVSINVYNNQETAFLDLLAGRVNGVMSDTPIILEWLKHPGKQRFQIIGKPIKSPTFFGTGYGIAVRKNNPRLLNTLNQAIDAINADGTYDKIMKQYFPEEVNMQKGQP